MSGIIGSVGSPSGIIGRRADNQVWCKMVLYNSGNSQGFSAGSYTKVGLDSAKESYGLGMADTTNEYMVVPAGHSGWWLLGFQLSYYSDQNNISDHFSKISVERGGTAVENVGGYHWITDTASVRHAIGSSTSVTELQAGDILKLYGRSDGSNLNFFYGDTSGTQQTYMYAVKLNDTINS